jgi:EF hand
MKLIACLLLLAPLPAWADSANVAKASRLLDFGIARLADPAGEEAGLKALDIDRDGQVSRAEAAGNAEVTLAFDRADRNRNGRISPAEWQRYERWRERRAKARESASAGATRARKPRRSAP